ncbi:variable surface protein [Plasmodium gonderi]|uniref:Variable surface protein n=1 Tax=Plasmodium gonderi TaxID=77519 RepID=A0A1Y1JSX5_PLAGO|nr:variable surface protein [Plasmodium gonderi]GAW84538.1 variable surface protein [Plasmodium gonderi]
MADGSTYPFNTNELTYEKYYNMLNTGIQNVSNIFMFCAVQDDNSINHYPSIKEFCSKLTHYLINENKNLKLYNSINDFCNILSYWLYGKLEQMCKSVKCKANDIYKKIFNILIRISKSTLYREKFFFNCKIDSNINLKNNWFVADCTYSSGTECPIPYEKFKNCDPRELQKYFNCQKEAQEEIASLKTSSPETSDIYPEASDDFSSAPIITSTDEISDGRLIDEYETPEESYIIDNGLSPLAVFGNVLLGGIITSLLVGVLYKFTPIGNQLRNIMVNRMNTFGHIKKERNELYNDVSEYLNPYYNDPQDHYVGYSSL